MYRTTKEYQTVLNRIWLRGMSKSQNCYGTTPLLSLYPFLFIFFFRSELVKDPTETVTVAYLKEITAKCCFHHVCLPPSASPLPIRLTSSNRGRILRKFQWHIRQCTAWGPNGLHARLKPLDSPLTFLCLFKSPLIPSSPLLLSRIPRKAKEPLYVQLILHFLFYSFVLFSFLL